MIDTTINKYNLDFSIENDINPNVNRLVNQIWKLIPMLENNEDWKKQLDTVIIEVAGMNEIFLHNPLFLQLLSKLEGLRISFEDFRLFRKTVFESISLLRGLIK